MKLSFNKTILNQQKFGLPLATLLKVTLQVAW